MSYTAELVFFTRLLDKMRIKSEIIQKDALSHDPDFGLRRLLGLADDYRLFFTDHFNAAKENTLYRMSDPFGCTYIFMLLPRRAQRSVLLMGPYLSFVPTAEALGQMAQRFSLPSSKLNMLQKCFSHVTTVEDTSTLLSLINGFAETVWGGSSSYEIADLTAAPSPLYISELSSPSADADDSSVLIKMELMERRYSFENQLIENISQGRQHRAELMLSNFSNLVFEKRSQDPLRNMKNYCIICNTLMRKAAEWGGVHPLHIDNLSSDFARRIEAVSNTESASRLILEMSRGYCRLVKDQKDAHYSPAVQKAVIYIEDHISSPLSLHLVAEQLSLSPAYLSALFKKETGKTITDHVTEKRMKLASGLLVTTRLQVQAVAQRCGILDVNYFSKIFKKYHSLTPKQYREQNSKTIFKD